MKILYIHGLASGKDSRTSLKLRELLPNDEVLAPEIPINPREAEAFINKFIYDNQPDIVIGSSLGGFYAMKVGDMPRILINPLMNPKTDILAVGYGEHEFFADREDGSKTFVIDNDFVNTLQYQANWFYDKCLDFETKSTTIGIFGKNDKLLHNDKIFKEVFSKEPIYCESEHRISDEDIENVLLKEINKIKEGK